MTRAEVINKLQSVFERVFTSPVIISEQLSASDVPEWNSISHIVLVYNIEEEFKLRFKLGEVARLKNVGELIDLLLDRVK